MSARKKNVIIVKGWSDPKKGKLYRGVVREATKGVELAHVIIENLDPSQLGRIHEMDLPWPVRPSRYHRTCSFLMACGIDAIIDGVSIDLNEIAGTTVGMRFSATAQDGSQKIDFERVKNPSRDQTNTSGSEPAGEQLSDSALQSEAESEKYFRMD